MPVLEFLVLFVVGLVAAAISGAAGFGGALLLLPLLVARVGAEQAVPLLTLAQIIGNLSRAGFGIAEIRWKSVGLFLAGAVPFSILGAVFFVQFPERLMTRVIGAAILLLVTLQGLGVLKLRPGPGWQAAAGGCVGFLSGFVGSAGPLGAAVFLTLGLPPVAYVASEAMTALVIHSLKMIVYGRFIILGREFWLMAALLGLAMVVGTYAANRYIRRLTRPRFHRLVTILLVIIAVYMITQG